MYLLKNQSFLSALSLIIWFSGKVSGGYSSSSLEGNVMLTIRASTVTIIIIEIGQGVSSSATKGEKTVANLAQKLQIPIAVARFNKGNVLLSLKLTK